ncbi:UNVERIFIED_ORG: YmgG-like glycine-zipper protein [Burkholderia sp. CF145]|nr:outer membrane efflux protein [Burkholderia sp. BT03]SKD07724.1 YMGG-like Gly-zipper [Paraburkholderia hospita]
MQPLMRFSLGVVMLALGCSVAAQQPIIYPAKGQSPQRQQSDIAECQTWAKQSTGVDPVALAQQASTQPGAPPPQGGRLKGAAGGTALGAAGGAIAGDAGKGAAIGAVVGTAAGGTRQRRTQRAAAFPTISLTGLFGTASGQFSKLFTGPARIWSYAGSLTVPIFTAGSISGQVSQAEAQQQQALFQYQQSIQVAFQEVDDALIALQKSREQLVVQGRQVDALRTYSRLARLRYEGGYTSYIEVLDAERSLFNAQLSYTQTNGLVFTSLIGLYKAMGGGWVVEAERMTGQVMQHGAAAPAAAQTATEQPQ